MRLVFSLVQEPDFPRDLVRLAMQKRARVYHVTCCNYGTANPLFAFIISRLNEIRECMGYAKILSGFFALLIVFTKLDV